MRRRGWDARWLPGSSTEALWKQLQSLFGPQQAHSQGWALLALQRLPARLPFHQVLGEVLDRTGNDFPPPASETPPAAGGAETPARTHLHVRTRAARGLQRSDASGLSSRRVCHPAREQGTDRGLLCPTTKSTPSPEPKRAFLKPWQ